MRFFLLLFKYQLLRGTIQKMDETQNFTWNGCSNFEVYLHLQIPVFNIEFCTWQLWMTTKNCISHMCKMSYLHHEFTSHVISHLQVTIEGKVAPRFSSNLPFTWVGHQPYWHLSKHHQIETHAHSTTHVPLLWNDHPFIYFFLLLHELCWWFEYFSDYDVNEKHFHLLH